MAKKTTRVSETPATQTLRRAGITFSEPVWRRLSALFDEALDLAADERPAWIEKVATREPDLVDELRAMLDDHAASQDAHFLTGSVGAPLDPVGAGAGLAGQTLGAYTLERPIGEGGMGSVWL